MPLGKEMEFTYRKNVTVKKRAIERYWIQIYNVNLEELIVLLIFLSVLGSVHGRWNWADEDLDRDKSKGELK